MCLITSNFYHKKDKNNNVKCLVAQEDILVYKCLDCVAAGLYFTPFQNMPIKFKKGKYVYDESYMAESACCGEATSTTIYLGIHAYGTKAAAIATSEQFHRSSGTSMYYALIPKGSNFYIGLDEDIVSNNLIVYREKRCFDRHYSNIIDVKQYIDKYLKIK